MITLEDINAYNQARKTITNYRIKIGNLVRKWEVRNLTREETITCWEIYEDYIQITYCYTKFDEDGDMYKEQDIVEIPIEDFLKEVSNYD